jgi:hypothetical protein
MTMTKNGDKVRVPKRTVLYYAAVAGLCAFIVGVALSLSAKDKVWLVTGITLQSLGAAILFPILVSFAYDRLRERWLGDEVWRLFSELADAGIIRVYRDREYAENRDNAQTRLSDAFAACKSGEVCMMGPSLRVFFNPLGPFYADIADMLRHAGGNVTIRALIERADSSAVADRVAIEEPTLEPGDKPQTQRDAESSIAQAKALMNTVGPHLEVRRFMQAPYCTAVIFPDIAFFSPNLLAPVVPVRLPMILFRSGSHGYNMIKASFEHLWEHTETQPALSLPARMSYRPAADNES